MAEKNGKKTQINSELAMHIQKLMAEATSAETGSQLSTAASDDTNSEINSDVKSNVGSVTSNDINSGITANAASASSIDSHLDSVTDSIPDSGTDNASELEENASSVEEGGYSSNENGPSEKGPVEEEITEASKKDKKKAWGAIALIAGILLLLFLIGVGVTYYVESKRYEEVFFKNTFINNVDVSYKTPEEVKSYIKDLCKDYEIAVKSRMRDDETIKASDIDLVYVTGDEIDSILEGQEPLRFYFENSTMKEYDIPTMLKLDDLKLAQTCAELSSFDDSTVTESKNAYIGDYDANTSEYVIIPEENGNKITDKNKAVQYIKDSILNLEPAVDLEDIGESIYPVADILSDNKNLNSEKNNLDKFVKTRISYKDSDIVLDGTRIKDWLIIDDNKNVSVDESKIKAFVDELADFYDTVGTERPLTSWYGNETSVSGGTFGWLLDREAEFEELKTLIPESTVTEREPIFSKRGIVHGENDWGDTYVEINLAKQHLFFIKAGELVVETDVVSGGLQRKAGTPTGVYCINYKARNAVLRGPRKADGTYQWESPVSYWMPFNGGIGLHDATWRGSFGGNIYKYNGSHGCVNLPKSKAKIIYEAIETGTPVLVYDDDFVIVEKETETETETETKAKKKTKTNTQPSTQAATQPATQPTTQPETQPDTQPETQPSVTETTGEIGPGISNSQSSVDSGPGVQSAEPEVTYEAENLPGGM